MKKKTFFIGLVALTCGFLSGQTKKVGINTANPKESLEIDGTLKVTDLPISGSENAIYNGNAAKTTKFTDDGYVLVVNSDGVIGKKTKDKVDRVLIEGQESGTLDLSNQRSSLKDIYVLDKVDVILPTCNSDMDGKVINFYKWGGTPDAGSTYSFTGKTDQSLQGANGGIFNYANVGDYPRPSGVTSGQNRISIDGKNNTRFKLLKFVCIATYRDNFAWFLDFSSFTNQVN